MIILQKNVSQNFWHDLVATETGFEWKRLSTVEDSSIYLTVTTTFD